MNVDDVLKKLSEERTFGSRYPLRAVFAENMAEYDKLADRLSQCCDLTLNLGDYCGGGDVVPQFDKLSVDIGKNSDKHILLLSVGEYLRLCTKRELDNEARQFQAFWEHQQDEASKTRIITPFFAAKSFFDRAVPYIDSRQIDFIWSIGDKKQEGWQEDRDKFTITVYSPLFDGKIEGMISGIGEWLKTWHKRLKNAPVALTTRLYRYVEKNNGIVAVDVVDNPYEYIISQITDGSVLKKEWATDDFWITLIQDIKKSQQKISTENLLKNILNVQAFDDRDVLSRWGSLSNKQQWAAWVWRQLKEAKDYYGLVFKNAINPQGINDAAQNSIFQTQNWLDEWIEKRTDALELLDVSGYTSMMETVPEPEYKLRLLNYKIQKDRVFALKTIGLWLRDGAIFEDIQKALAERFPSLIQYLASCPEVQRQTNEYFKWYKRAKLLNRVPETAAPDIDVDIFNSRFKCMTEVLAEKEKDACFIFWIDGMGVEWLSLLLHELRKRLPSEAEFTVDIVASVAPTETEYNKQWDSFDFPRVKWDRLDKLAHEGIPDNKDYYSCIESQFSVIQEAANEAVGRMRNYECVVITGDHGSSRLAALTFHASCGIEAPHGSVVRSHGRFCELTAPFDSMSILPSQQLAKEVKWDEHNFLVMTGYEHFKQSGNAAGGNDDDNAVCGEVHGGMTPEEYLVPFVVISREKSLHPIKFDANVSFMASSQDGLMDYSAVETSVFRQGKDVTVELCFTCLVTSLEVVAFGSSRHKGKCTPQTPPNALVWQVKFTDVTEKQIILEAVVNGKMLSKQIEITVKTRGITINDELLGGL